MNPPIRARRSIGTMVAASLISAVCGVVQTFWIPKLLSVDSYGYWRMFLLYTGYAGLLHLGFIDGALLVWSKDPLHRNPDRRVFVRSLQFLLTQQFVLLAAIASLLLLRWPPIFAPILAALVLYTLLLNVLSVAQVYLQAHLQFGKVSLTYSLPGVLFVVLLAGLIVTRQVTVNRLLISYLAAWAITVSILLIQAYQFQPANGSIDSQAAYAVKPVERSSWREGLTYIVAGWPIMLANAGFGLMQSADRITINLTRPLHDFAIYSMSQSTIYVPITILAVISRVAFSYFASTTHEDRDGVYRSSSSAICLIWMILLPYYFAVEFVVTRFLPKYDPGLPAGRILLLSVLFLSLIQIVQLNTFSLHGRQRQFFAGALIAVAVAFATAWMGSRIIGTLAAVAWSQVITAMLWWLGNEYYIRKHAGVRWRDDLRILIGFSVAAAALYCVQVLTKKLLLDAALYTTLVLPACALLFPNERRILIARIIVPWTRAGSPHA